MSHDSGAMLCCLAGDARHIHKLMDVAEQPGGLATMTDDELRRWIANRRDGLAKAQRSKRGHKATSDWQDSLDAALDEQVQRLDD